LGCAVYSKELVIEPVKVETAFEGTLIIADVKLPDGIALPDETTLTMISLYGGINEKGRVSSDLHRVLSDLTPLLLGDLGKRWVVIGGDFNTSTQWEEGGRKWPGLSPQILFDRITDFGLVNCTEKFYDGHIQTYRHNRGNTPWQNDYLFVSKKFEQKLKACYTIDNEEVHQLSDHNPLVIELEI
jgi:exonuclease III